MGRKAAWPPRVYQHSSGQDRVCIRGTDIYLGPSGSEQARAAYARLLAQMTGPGDVLPALRSTAPPTTVADVAAEWLKGPGADYSPRGREQSQFRRVLKPLLRLFGGLPAGEFDCNRLEELQRAMASGSWMTDGEKEEAQKRGRPADWCRTTVNRRIVRVRTVWRWAERKGLVPRGSWAHLCTLPGLAVNNQRVRQPKPRRAVSIEEIRRVADKCSPVVRTMLLVQELAGMRSAEVRTLRPCEIDRTDPACWVYRPPEHKCDWRGQTRQVVLGNDCQELLKPLLEVAGPEEYLFPARRGRPDTVLVKPQKSKPYSANTYAQTVRRAAEQAGVANFRPYDCRHHAKQRITREHGLDTARAVLGQKSISTTDGYGDATDLDLAKKGAR